MIKQKFPRRKSRTYAGSYKPHCTAPVVNKQQCRYWSLVTRRALARYWYSTVPVWSQILARSRLRDLCRALARYWFSTQTEKSDLSRILRTAWYRASCKWGAMPVLIISTAPSVGAVLISTAPVWSPCVLFF